MQDTYDTLFSTESLRAPGTLSHAAQVFNRTYIKPENVIHAFHACYETIKFVGTSYILAFACELLELKRIEEKSELDSDDRTLLLIETSAAIEKACCLYFER